MGGKGRGEIRNENRKVIGITIPVTFPFSLLISPLPLRWEKVWNVWWMAAGEIEVLHILQTMSQVGIAAFSPFQLILYFLKQ